MSKPGTGSARRVRHPAPEARRRIIEVARRRLIAGGPSAVRVQSIAREIGITDAAIHYHFDSRDGLLRAAAKDAGRRMRDELEAVVAGWDADALDARRLVTRLKEMLEDAGYARLTAWMALNGSRFEGAGLLRPLADAIHVRRSTLARAEGLPPPDLEDTLYSVVLVGLVVWAESLTGDAWQRSVDVKEPGSGFMDWFVGRVSADWHMGNVRTESADGT